LWIALSISSGSLATNFLGERVCFSLPDDRFLSRTASFVERFSLRLRFSGATATYFGARSWLIVLVTSACIIALPETGLETTKVCEVTLVLRLFFSGCLPFDELLPPDEDDERDLFLCFFFDFEEEDEEDKDEESEETTDEDDRDDELLRACWGPGSAPRTDFEGSATGSTRQKQ
jgi:hypothetical protein